MAVRTREEMLSALNAHLGEDTSDSALALVEDLTDTLDSLSGNSGGVNWQQRYEENDRAWRQKYRDRFFGKGTDDNDSDDNDNEDKNKNKKPRTYADLFKK